MSNQISNLHPYWFRALANEYDARARSVAEFIAGQRLALATAKGPDDRIQRLEYGVMSNLEFDHRIKLSIAVCKRRRAPRQTPQDRRLQKQEGRDRAVQGTGRNDARTAQGNDDEPQFAYPVQVSIGEGLEDATAEVVTALMGTKPEARFNFIQSNAEFAKNLDI